MAISSSPRPGIVLRVLAVAVALIATATVGSVATTQTSWASDAPTHERAPRQSWYDGACTNGDGVTVVIDFQELGGGVNVRCAPAPVSSGLDALDRAGIAWEGTLRFPGVVCRIAGRPGPADEACGNTPPSSAYWSYWMAPRGGSWCYSNFGAANRTPPPGTVEGWSFALNKASSEIPPPGLAPPAPAPGVTPTPLNSSDCTSPVDPGEPTTTVRPTTTTRPTTTVATTTATTVRATSTTTSTTTGTTVRPTTTTRPTSPATTTRLPTSSTVAVSTTAGTVVSTTTTTLADRVTASTTGDPSSTTSTGPATSTIAATSTSMSAAASSPTSAVATDDEIALGTVDLGDDGRDGSGFGAMTALSLIAIGCLITAGVVVARRRRVDETAP